MNKLISGKYLFDASAGIEGALKGIADIIENETARTAQAIEARRAETGTGSVHESAVPTGCAKDQSL